jgi:hypothetical protein
MTELTPNQANGTLLKEWSSWSRVRETHSQTKFASYEHQQQYKRMGQKARPSLQSHLIFCLACCLQQHSSWHTERVIQCFLQMLLHNSNQNPRKKDEKDKAGEASYSIILSKNL